MLEVLFRSKVVIKLLDYFMRNPDKELYLREVSREIDEPASAVQRELQRLEDFGLIETFWKDNHRHFKLKEDFPILPELKGLFLKSEGIVDYLKKCIGDLEDVKLAFIYGEFAKNQSLTADIKLVIIGNISNESIERTINTIQSALRRRIYYQLYTPEEFAYLLENRKQPIASIYDEEKLVLTAKVLDKVKA